MILPYNLQGNRNSKTLLVFLHGWPDTMDLWRDYIAEYKTDNLCLAITYPNYSNDLEMEWGIEFKELCKSIHETILSVIKGKEGMKVILVGHDWGSLFSMMVDIMDEGFYSHLVLMDVSYTRRNNVVNIALQAIYFSLLAFAFMIEGFVGNSIAKVIAKLWQSFDGYKSPHFQRIHSGMGFFYLKLLKQLLLITFRIQYSPFRPTKTPKSFIYGKNKVLNYHSEAFLREILESGGIVKGLSGCHWSMFVNPSPCFEVIDSAILSFRK